MGSQALYSLKINWDPQKTFIYVPNMFWYLLLKIKADKFKKYIFLYSFKSNNKSITHQCKNMFFMKIKFPK